MIVTREVRLALVFLLLMAVSVKVVLGFQAAVIVMLFAAPIIYVFRDPLCRVPASPLGVLSPAHGLIESIETVTDPWLNRTVKRYRIRMSFLNIHTLRSPAEGKVRNQWVSATDEPGLKRRYTYWIQTDEGDDVVLSVATGAWAPFTRINLHCGERTGQGQRCGYLYFAGVIDVLLPERTRIDLKPGTIVNSGSSILGQLIRHKAPPISDSNIV
jgi:phosphatidylserine decarboxylase